MRPVVLATLLLALLLPLAPTRTAAEPGAPRVVSISPSNGATDVDPATSEIRITFSEPMRDRSWSVVGGGPNFPEIRGIGYEDGGKVLVISVALKPGWPYRYGLNSPRHRNFVSRRGVPLEPVVVSFATSGQAPAEAAPAGHPRVVFDLLDVNGVRIRSPDYAGVPIFLVFGAAW
jgi:hypothetical protein